ncbi:(Na+)-NQR maturation NqrM [Gammaproteobacteria bacterium]|nr:(Na+)-NQR maturation NqrM [Gammaproteobacteria bacterium]
MFEFLLVFLVMAISFAAIAVGVIAKDKPITGSCGGLANLEKGGSCQICGRTSSEICDT